MKILTERRNNGKKKVELPGHLNRKRKAHSMSKRERIERIEQFLGISDVEARNLHGLVADLRNMTQAAQAWKQIAQSRIEYMKEAGLEEDFKEWVDDKKIEAETEESEKDE